MNTLAWPFRPSTDSRGGALSHSRRRPANRSSAWSRKSSLITTTSLTPSALRTNPSRRSLRSATAWMALLPGSKLAVVSRSPPIASRMFSVGGLNFCGLYPSRRRSTSVSRRAKVRLVRPQKHSGSARNKRRLACRTHSPRNERNRPASIHSRSDDYIIAMSEGQEMRSQPAIALLSNGSYSVMITAACAGYSTWRDLDITRWREDATRDCWGQFYYVRDLSDESLWSIGVQPLLKTSDECAFEFHPDRAEFRRSDGDVETLCAVCVMPDADAEVRAVTLVNHGCRPREFELTSYAEVCLNDRKADQAHPAFAKLFLETEFDPRFGALLARRRPRSVKEHPVWAIHASAASVSPNEIEYETDRMRFLGRGRPPANPAALGSGSRLSRTTGPVLDPIFSLRRRVTVEPGMATRVAFVTGAADTYEVAIGIAESIPEVEAIDQAFAGAKAHSQRELRELGLKPDEIALFNRLAAAVIFTNSGFRDLDAVAANRLGQAGLWPHAISGDLPIVLVRVTGADDETVGRQ